MFRVFAHAQLCLTVSVKPSVIGDAAAAVVVRLEKRKRCHEARCTMTGNNNAHPKDSSDNHE